jgi:hypothetical protein
MLFCVGKQLRQVSLTQRIDSQRFLDRINQASLKSFALAGRMVRMLPAQPEVRRGGQ